MKKIMVFVMLLLAATPILKGQERELPTVKYSMFNEYGLYFGGSNGFSGVFVNGAEFKDGTFVGLGLGYQTDWYSQSIPIFLNLRHYFRPQNRFSPLVNLAIGTQMLFDTDVDFGTYATIGAGFKAGAFSFCSGFFFKQYPDRECVMNSDNQCVPGDAFTGGVELKVGFAF